MNREARDYNVLMPIQPVGCRIIPYTGRQPGVYYPIFVLGIPVLAASQGLVAVLGYKIFGVDSYVLLGMLTGVFSIVPVVGCAIVWVPVCAYLGSTGHTTAAIGLAIYSFIITGGIDNVLRFTILKKLGDVHPIVTTIGIIVGVPMFGFMGFIFGPLLVSYLLLLIKIYRVEFATEPTADN